MVSETSLRYLVRLKSKGSPVTNMVNRFCLASNIRAECEVFGAFTDLIPVHALKEEDEGFREENRQRLLPDFRLEVPSAQGETTYRLAKPKTIGAVPKWYSRSGGCARRERGVESEKLRE